MRAVAPDVAADLWSRGLRQIDADATVRGCFYSVAKHLALVPSLETEIERLVREVTLLEAAAGYDVSHSEPRWPSAIFVSAPPATARHAALRLAENVVHEGMHLRLTDIEKRHPLVSGDGRRLFSPWKERERDVQGVLHGVYVFTCIAVLLGQPRFRAALDGEGKAYADRRLVEIGFELGAVDLAALADGLNERGRRFLRETLMPDVQPWTVTAS